MTTVTRTPRQLYSHCHSLRLLSGMRQLSSQPAKALRLAPQYKHLNTQTSHIVPRHTKLASTQIRPFTASSLRPTKAIFNPRKDEEGGDMIVDILPRAANRLHSIAEKDKNPKLCLRVAVESGGCHGFQYLMSLTNTDKIDQEEDTIFESEDGKGAKVVMDEPSLELLKGSKIDYTMELIGSQFKVTGIPGATSSCGCGSSFDVKA